MRARYLIALLALGCVLAPGARDAQAQQWSGRVARAFLAAVSDGDLDAAMALVADEVELQTPAGDVIQGAAAVREYLAALPHPIESGDVLPWGGQKIEARVTAGGVPLLFIFDGGGGVIVFIDIQFDSN